MLNSASTVNTLACRKKGSKLEVDKCFVIGKELKHWKRLGRLQTLYCEMF